MAAPLVLHVVRPAAGGMREHVLNLLAGMDRGSYHPAVAFPPDPGWEERLRRLGVPAFSLPIAPGLSPARDLEAVRRLRCLIVQLAPALIHCHGAKAALVARLAAAAPLRQQPGAPRAVATPVVYTVHGPSAPGSPARAWLADLAERRLAPATAAFIAVSRPLGERVVRAWRVPPERVHVIPNGIDLGPFHRMPSRARARRALGLAPGRPAIGMAARLAPEKGADSFIRAAALIARRHGDIQFAVAGDGPERLRLERQAADLGLGDRIRFLGFQANIPVVLAALDVFVVPSRSEGLPLVLLEAMAAGRAVVATRVGGVPDVVADGRTGLLVPPHDPHALVLAAGLLLEDEVLRQRLAAAARRHVQRCFTRDLMVERTTAVYRSLLAPAAASRGPVPRHAGSGEEAGSGSQGGDGGPC